MSVEITRFVKYNGGKGNALAFADVVVRESERAYVFRDMKLYRDGTGFQDKPQADSDPARLGISHI
jgi:hypothetical protein